MIFVQDNGSVDNVERMTSLFPEVILSKNTSNIGYSKAVNKALKVSNAFNVVLLNPDSYVMKGFFENALRHMKENSQVGILGPKILNSDGSVQGSARSFPSPITGLFGRNTLLTRWFPNNRFSRQNVIINRSDGMIPIEVDWVSGACMVVRKAAIDDVGPLDERFFLYWEDADWCRRMWESGWKVVYYPQAAVMHYVGGSSEKLPLRSTVEFHKSAYRLYAKEARGAQRFAKPLAMWALGLRFLLSFSWYVLHHWSGRTRGHTQHKDTPPTDD
jgi:GT2 family glycosyltransferase